MSTEAGQIQETPAQREMLKMAVFKAQRAQQYLSPAIRRIGQQVTAANEEGSFERERAMGGAQTDVAAAFAPVQQAVRDRSADTGTLGSARGRLAAVQTAADKATASAMGTVAADQRVNDQYVSGLGTLTSIGAGQQAVAEQGMQTQADVSAQQARTAAQASLDRRLGNAELAGQAIGTGVGLWSAPQQPYDYDYRGTTLPNELRGGR